MYLHTNVLSSVASLSSLISGDPYYDININNIDDIYTSALGTSLTRMGVSVAAMTIVLIYNNNLLILANTYLRELQRFP